MEKSSEAFLHLSQLQPGCSTQIYGLLTRPNSPGSRADEPGSQATPFHQSLSKRSNPAPTRPGHRLPSAPLTCRRRHSHGLLETPDNLVGFGGYLSLSLSLPWRPQHYSDPSASRVQLLLPTV